MRSSRELRAVGACAVAVGLGGLAGVAGSTGVAVAVAAAVVATALASLFVDQFVGFLIGLSASAALILGRRVLGPWGEDEFWIASAQTVALVVVGLAAANAGRAVQRGTADQPPRTGLLPEPVFGSLGLLDADIGLERLQEEVERARSHRRPLTVLVIDVAVTGSAPADVARAARRAVSRLFESQLPGTDVPFALAEDRLVAILPETTAADAWQRVGDLLESIADGRFGVRSEDGDRSLAETVGLEVGMAELQPGVEDAQALLDAATAALPRHEGAGEPG